METQNIGSCGIGICSVFCVSASGDVVDLRFQMIFLSAEMQCCKMHVAKIQAHAKERAAESISCFLNFSIGFINNVDFAHVCKMGSER